MFKPPIFAGYNMLRPFSICQYIGKSWGYGVQVLASMPSQTQMMKEVRKPDQLKILGSHLWVR